MKHPNRQIRSLVAAALVLWGAGMARAQFVLIPDTNMRAWLNMMAPGSVDSAGYLDTLSPTLVMPPWVTSVSVYVNWSPSDLTGLQYVQGFDDLLVQYAQPATSTIPAFPDDLDRITLEGFPGATLPAFPSSVTKLLLGDCPGLVTLPPLPPGIEILSLHACPQIGTLPTLPGTVYSLSLSSCGSLNVLPPPPAALWILQISSCPLLGPVLTVNPTLGTLELEDLPLLTSVVGAPALRSVELKDLPALTTLPPIVSTCGQGGVFIENVPNLPLPAGPWNAYSIWISKMPWTALPAMPCAERLGMVSVPLGTLPPWPPALDVLWMDSVPTTGVLNLPPSLTELHVERSAVTGIANWPNDPQEIVISGCDQLTSLPAAPLARSDPFYYVYDIEFSDCPLLAELPVLVRPLQLTIVGLPLLDSVFIAQQGAGDLLLQDLPVLTHLSSLPAGTTDIVDCPLLSCLPPLPDNCSSLPPPNGCLQLTNTGITCFPNYPAWVGTLGVPSAWPPLCTVVNSTCPEVRPVIAGMVYQDVNNNGVWDPSEPPLPNVTIEVAPGGHMGMSNGTGAYEIAADTATFQVFPIPPQYHVVTTPAQITTFSSYLQIDTLDAFGLYQLPNVTDLVAHLTAPVPPVLGFDRNLFLSVSNTGTVSTGATIELAIDPVLAWVSSTVAPTQITGSTVQWVVPAMAPGSTWTTDVMLHTPLSTMLGDTTQLVFSAIPLATDTTPGDNIETVTEIVVSSYDPNDKTVSPTQATPNEVSLGLVLDYTIRIQNTGTWPASRVVITDTLSEDLDWSSFRFIASSHACTWYMLGGVLHFVFDPINLPDSGMDQLGSNGFVRFMIQAEPGLVNGTQVHNVANIYFDFNAPVITNAAVFGVETYTGVNDHAMDALQLWPVPASEVLRVAVPEAGQLIVLDILGREVLRQRVYAQGVLAVAIAHLVPGTYVMRYSNARGELLAQVFVKE